MFVLLSAIAVLLAPTASAAATATSQGPPGGPDTQVAASIPVGDSPADVAVNDSTDTVYATVGLFSAPSVWVINGHTNKVVAKVPVHSGGPVGALAVDPGTNRIFVLNRLGDITVIDGRTNRVLTTFAFTNVPGGGIADDPATGLLYATGEPRGSSVYDMYAISARTDKVTAHFPVQPGLTEVKVDLRTDRVYAIGGGSNGTSPDIVVINGATHKVLATVALGAHPHPIQLAVDNQTDTIYVTDDNGIIYVIDGRTNTLAGTVQDDMGPWGIAVNGVAGYFYVTNPGDNNVSVYSAQTGQQVAVDENASLNNNPVAAVVDTRTNTTYVANQDDNTVDALVPATP